MALDNPAMAAPRISDRQVSAFRAAVRLGSLTAAAAVLHVSQPAVSRLLKDLEQEVGFALFERIGRGVQVTQQGRLLFEEVERAFVGVEAITQRAMQLREGSYGRLRVAAMPAFADAFVAPAVGALLQAASGLSVEFDVLNTNDIVDGILRERFDIGVAAPSFAHPGIVWQVLRAASMVAVMRADHPLAAETAVKAAHLATHDVIALPADSPYQVQLRVAVARAAKRGVRITTTVRTQSAACVAIAHGAPALAVVDPCVARLHGAGLLHKPLAFSLISEVAVCHPRGEPSASVERFKSLLRAAIERG